MHFVQMLLNEHSSKSPDQGPYTNDDTLITDTQESGQCNLDCLDKLWTEKETLLLIDLYEQHMEDFSNAKKKKHVWSIISEKLAAQNYNVNYLWINHLKI